MSSSSLARGEGSGETRLKARRVEEGVGVGVWDGFSASRVGVGELAGGGRTGRDVGVILGVCVGTAVRSASGVGLGVDVAMIVDVKDGEGVRVGKGDGSGETVERA